MRKYTIKPIGKINQAILDTISGTLNAYDSYDDAKKTLEETAIENYTKLAKLEFIPTDLLPVGDTDSYRGTLSAEEFDLLLMAEAERMYYRTKRAKYDMVNRYMNDRDNMTTNEKKIGKACRKTVKDNLKKISKNYKEWLDADKPKAGDVKKRKTRTPKHPVEAVREFMDKALGKVDNNETIFDKATMHALIEPVTAYLDSIGRAPSNDKLASYDAKGKKRSKK